jgi:hypothetical protein
MSRRALWFASGLILITLTSLFLVSFATAASSTIGWSNTYGGPRSDKAYGMIRTREGGYALVGSTNSYGSGLINAWLVKTDVDGVALWNQSFSGLGQGLAAALVQTSDNGYAITGYTYSFQQSSTGQGSSNVGSGELSLWIVRTDYLGNLVWNQTYTQVGTSIGYSIIQTSDGGFAVVGTSNSLASSGKAAWLLKVDGNGVFQWYTPFVNTHDEELFSVVQTSDGGYVLGGDTDSLNTTSLTSLLMIKTDSSGVQQWNQSYPFSSGVIMSNMVSTNDGGYLLTGTLETASGDRYLMVKTDSAGNMQWNQTYGASGTNDLLSGIQTSDGGYAVIGVSNSSGAAFVKALLLKTDSGGNAVWNQTYGGNGLDVAGAVAQASDGGYAIAGYTNATGAGLEDFWLLKTDANGVFTLPSTPSPSVSATASPSESPTSSPTPNGGFIWTSTMTLAVIVVVVVVAALAGGFFVWRNTLKTKGKNLEEEAKSLEGEGKLLEAAVCYAKACQADIQMKLRQPALETLGKFVSLARPLALNAALSDMNSKQLGKIRSANNGLAKSVSSKSAQELLQRPETQKVRDLETLLDNCKNLNLDFVVDEALKDKGLKKQLQTAVGGVDKMLVSDVAVKLGYSREATLKMLAHAADQRLISGHVEDDQTFVADIYVKKP